MFISLMPLLLLVNVGVLAYVILFVRADVKRLRMFKCLLFHSVAHLIISFNLS